MINCQTQWDTVSLSQLLPIRPMLSVEVNFGMER